MKASTSFVKERRAHSTLILGAALAFVTGAQAQLPDLIVNRSRLVSSIELQTRNFAASDCAVVEGCINAGTRKLLLFEVTFANIGRGDLIIGNPADNPGLFHHSPCHDHSHLEGSASYDLLSSDGRRMMTARKQAFCFRDNEPYLSTAGPSRGYDCEYQGITAGWQDVYSKGLDCQWLDVTTLPGGSYTLRITVNPERRFAEANYNNNTVSVTVQVPGVAAPRTSPPTSVTPSTATPTPRFTPPPKKAKQIKKPKKNKGKHRGGWFKKAKKNGHARSRGPGDDDDDD